MSLILTIDSRAESARAARAALLDLACAREASLELFAEEVTRHVDRLMTLAGPEQAMAIAELLDAAAVLVLAGWRVELAAGLDLVDLVAEIEAEAERFVRRRR